MQFHRKVQGDRWRMCQKWHTPSLDTLYVKYSLIKSLPLKRLNARRYGMHGKPDTNQRQTLSKHRSQTDIQPPRLKWNIERDEKRGGGEKCESRQESAVLRLELFTVHGWASLWAQHLCTRHTVVCLCCWMLLLLMWQITGREWVCRTFHVWLRTWCGGKSVTADSQKRQAGCWNLPGSLGLSLCFTQHQRLTCPSQGMHMGWSVTLFLH